MQILKIVPSPIHPQFRVVDGLSIRFAESDDQANGPHVLLLSPWPESLFAFEQVWKRLSTTAHLIAVDLPGFGHSERRESLMAPKAMGEFILRLVDEFEMGQPHVVAPDIGTAASLFAAALHPGRLRSLLVGSGAAAVPLMLSGVLKEWVGAPDLELYRRMGGDAIVNAAIGTLEKYKPSDIAHNDYLSAYKGEKFAESMSYVRAYPKDLPVLRDQLPGIQTPVLIIAGQRDAVVPIANAEFLDALLPSSKLVIVDAAHFVWEDAADQYAEILRDWLEGGYSTQ